MPLTALHSSGRMSLDEKGHEMTFPTYSGLFGREQSTMGRLRKNALGLSYQ